MRDGKALKNLPAKFQKDREVVLEAVMESGWALEFAHKSLKEDPKILANIKKDKWYKAGKGDWDN